MVLGCLWLYKIIVFFLFLGTTNNTQCLYFGDMGLRLGSGSAQQAAGYELARISKQLLITSTSNYAPEWCGVCVQNSSVYNVVQFTQTS